MTATKSRTPGDSDLIGLRFFFFETSLGDSSVQLKLKTTRLDFLSPPFFFFFAVDLALIFCSKWEKGKLRLLTQVRESQWASTQQLSTESLRCVLA